MEDQRRAGARADVYDLAHRPALRLRKSIGSRIYGAKTITWENSPTSDPACSIEQEMIADGTVTAGSN